jgi:hypothetical protein
MLADVEFLPGYPRPHGRSVVHEGNVMTISRRLFCCSVLSLGLFAGAAVSAPSRGRTHVYLVRGIFDVSVGLDALAGKLARMGIAASVHGHGDAASLATQAIGDYRSGRAISIILIGHSLGAGAVMSVARGLNEAGVPVALLISLDPVSSATVSSNVRRAVNFYVSGSGVPVDAEAGFRGDLRNVDVGGEPGMDHMAIQATEAMHARMIAYVRAAAGGARPHRPATARHGHG